MADPNPILEDATAQWLARQSRVIVSIFPLEQTVVRRHNGIKTYHLPAAKPGEYVKLVVTGVVDPGIDYTTEPYTWVGRPVPVDVVVEDLVRAFTRSQLEASDSAGPGIGPIRGEEPTREELEELRARQEKYARMLVEHADALFAKGDLFAITPLHRAMARWLGVEDREWVRELSFKPTKHCIACTETIPVQARVCQFCRTDLVSFMEANPDVDRSADPFVAELVNKRRKLVKTNA